MYSDYYAHCYGTSVMAHPSKFRLVDIQAKEYRTFSPPPVTSDPSATPPAVVPQRPPLYGSALVKKSLLISTHPGKGEETVAHGVCVYMTYKMLFVFWRPFTLSPIFLCIHMKQFPPKIVAITCYYECSSCRAMAIRIICSTVDPHISELIGTNLCSVKRKV